MTDKQEVKDTLWLRDGNMSADIEGNSVRIAANGWGNRTCVLKISEIISILAHADRYPVAVYSFIEASNRLAAAVEAHINYYESPLSLRDIGKELREAYAAYVKAALDAEME